MAHTELDLRERRAIEDMLNSKVPVSKIAVEIGRHRSTVYHEIKRNYFTDEELPYLSGYYGMNAQRYASDRRSHVIAQLKIGWTPEQIAGRLGYDDQPVRVSHEKIYACVYSIDAIQHRAGKAPSLLSGRWLKRARGAA